MSRKIFGKLRDTLGRWRRHCQTIDSIAGLGGEPNQKPRLEKPPLRQPRSAVKNVYRRPLPLTAQIMLGTQQTTEGARRQPTPKQPRPANPARRPLPLTVQIALS